VISNPEGPYADAHVGESLFAYDYRAGSTDGDNRKLRRAYELQLPIILLRNIRAGGVCAMRGVRPRMSRHIPRSH
jgi:putative restriction endonuclease